MAVDDYVLEKIHEALKKCHAKDKLDVEYYSELKGLFNISDEPTSNPESEPEVDSEVKEEESVEQKNSI